MRSYPSPAEYDPASDPAHRAQRAQQIPPIRQGAEQQVEQGIQHIPQMIQARMQDVERILAANHAGVGDRIGVLRGELSRRFFRNGRDLFSETVFERPYAPIRELWRSVRHAFAAPRDIAMTSLEQEQLRATDTAEAQVREVVDQEMERRRAAYAAATERAQTLKAQLAAAKSRISELEAQRILLVQRQIGPSPQLLARLQQEQQQHVQLTTQLRDVSRDIYDIVEEIKATDVGARTAVEEMHAELTSVSASASAVIETHLRDQLERAFENDARAERDEADAAQREADAWIQTQKTQSLPTSPLPFALRRRLKDAKDALNKRNMEILSRFGHAFGAQQQVTDRLLFRSELLAPTAQMPLQFGGQPAPFINVVLLPNPPNPQNPPILPNLPPAVRARATAAMQGDLQDVAQWIAVFHGPPPQQPGQPPQVGPWPRAQGIAHAEAALIQRLGVGTFEATKAAEDLRKADTYLRNYSHLFLPILSLAHDEADYVQRLAYEVHVHLNNAPGQAVRPLYVEPLAPGLLAAAAVFAATGNHFTREHARRAEEQLLRNELEHPLALQGPFSRTALQAALGNVPAANPGGRKTVYSDYCADLVDHLEGFFAPPPGWQQGVYPTEGLALLLDAIEASLPDVERYSTRTRGQRGQRRIQQVGPLAPRFGAPGNSLMLEIAVIESWLATASRLRDRFINENAPNPRIDLSSFQKHQVTVLKNAEQRIRAWITRTVHTMP